MAVYGNYFLDAATLSGATAVFTDATLTTAAPDGYYSDSIVVRRQVGGVLTSSTPACPDCAFPCGQGVNASGDQGIYDITFSVGTNIGATIIYVDVGTIPDGIKVSYDSANYNELASENFGYLASNNINNFTYVGVTADDCSIGTTLDGGGYSGLQQYTWNSATSSFDNVGSSGAVTGTSGDVDLTATAPGWCTVYFPKTAATPETGVVQVFGPCTSTGWNVEINCPVALTGVPGRVFGAVDCLLGDLPNRYFNVPNRGGTAGDPQLHEFLCLDENGVNRAPADTYVVEVGGERKKLVVDANGVITLVSVC